MPPPNESTDATPNADSPTADPEDSTMNQMTDQNDRHTVYQPFCRIFGGPMIHRVQFTGPESRPATAIDPTHNERPPSDNSHLDDDLWTGENRALSSVWSADSRRSHVHSNPYRKPTGGASHLRWPTCGWFEFGSPRSSSLSRSTPSDSAPTPPPGTPLTSRLPESDWRSC